MRVQNEKQQIGSCCGSELIILNYLSQVFTSSKQNFFNCALNNKLKRDGLDLVEKESINDKDTTKSAPSKLQQLTLARGGDCEDK